VADRKGTGRVTGSRVKLLEGK